MSSLRVSAFITLYFFFLARVPSSETTRRRAAKRS
jgi:hypothetical protein